MLHERRDLAGAIRAHLDHREAVRRLEAMQRERHADVVVEIAARREARPGLRRGSRAIISLTVVLPLLPATPTIGHRELRAPRAAEPARARSACRRRRSAPCACRLRVSTTAPAAPAASAAPTNSLPLKRGPRSATNSSPALERARVGGHAGVGAVGAVEPAAAGARELSQACLAPSVRCTPASSAAPATTAWSLNGAALACRRSGSPRGPCPRSARRRPRAAADSASRIALRAIVLDAERLAGGNARARCPRRSRCGILGARVVVGDHDVVGELRGDRAHQRALAGVAIAAAAEHDDAAGRGNARAPRDSALRSASGVCA